MIDYSINDKMIWEKPTNEKDYIWRYSGNPLFDMENNDFWHICNSAVVLENNKYIGIFRCEDKEGRPDFF